MPTDRRADVVHAVSTKNVDRPSTRQFDVLRGDQRTALVEPPIAHTQAIGTPEYSYVASGSISRHFPSALLAGCVLIKPRTDFIDSSLPLDERHYVACRPDFSDLQQRIREVLDDWPRYAARAPQLREYVVAARKPDRMADCYAAAFRESVGVIR